MKFPLRKAHAPLVLAVIAVFLLSFLIASLAMALTPWAYYEQRVYSMPSFDYPSGGSSSVGGEAFAEFNLANVVVGPAPGDMNVSRDTMISVDEWRPVHVDLHLTPETRIAKITKEEVGHASEITTLYPADLLQPATTYNVSGTIMGLSAWWTFTTGLEPDQWRTERILLPQVFWIAVAAATLTTAIFTVTVGAALWRRRQTKRPLQAT